MMSTCSVVIATRNREALLERTLAALAAQRWPSGRFEVVVADNGSSDGTRDVVARATRSRDNVRYCFVDTPGKSAAVNEGIAMASGDFIALTDDDVQPEPAWIERLAVAFDETGADFVAGRILPIWEVPPPAWLSRDLYGVLAVPDNGGERLTIGAGGGTSVIPIGANMAVRRSVVDRIGGLRADFGKLEGTLRTGEDHELFLRMLRAGYRGVYEPTAVVRHWVPADRLVPRYFHQWHYQNGRDVARLDRAYPLAVPHLCGVPRYLIREAAHDLRTAIAGAAAGDPARRFRGTTRLVWFGGHLREAWFGDRSKASVAHAPREREARAS